MPTRLGHGGYIHIPLDLTVEILKKLPTKSLMRFQCVSKLWSSIISSQDFIDLVMARSLTRPRRDVHLMRQDLVEKCFLAMFSATDMELVALSPHGEYYRDCQCVRGLICGWSINYQTRKLVVAICNPTTRESIYLPELKVSYMADESDLLFGYDPLENQYKVVFFEQYEYGNMACQVFTLGEKQWRTIQGVDGLQLLLKSVVCINGTIYYLAIVALNKRLLSFDVRSEKFHYVDVPETVETIFIRYSFPVNYQGKLGFISCCKKGLEVWVMEMETQGWSKVFFCEMDGFQDFLSAGATCKGEVVLLHRPRDMYTYPNCDSTLRVYYYDPNRNSMRYVDLEDYYYKMKGSRNIRLSISAYVLTVPDYVENTMRLN